MILKKASITFLVDRDNRTSIDIHDDEANINFVRIELTNDQLVSALSRLGNTPCERVEVVGLNKVGKKMEHKILEFEIPDRYIGKWKTDQSLLERLANNACSKGWKPDHYYNSQETFFNKNGKNYCKVTIRRYV